MYRGTAFSPLFALLMVCLVVGVFSLAAFGSGAEEAESERPGFTDTPYLPDGKWRVHDKFRPYPPIITPPAPGEDGTPGSPPSDAVVLFDGSDLSHWRGEKQGQLIEPGWKVENGYMETVPRAGNLVSKEEFGDCQIHIEWASPSQADSKGQGRGNSGVIIMGHYEIQVLDSYDNVTYADGQAGAMYGQYPPLVNASRPPGTWQTFDIVFEAPEFEKERLVKPAYATVLHNGIVIHQRQAFIGRMVYRKLAKYEPHGPTGPLMLQDHSNPVRYRNIWVRPLGNYR
jgi:hypothetical protein